MATRQFKLCHGQDPGLIILVRTKQGRKPKSVKGTMMEPTKAEAVRNHYERANGNYETKVMLWAGDVVIVKTTFKDTGYVVSMIDRIEFLEFDSGFMVKILNSAFFEGSPIAFESGETHFNLK